MITIIDYGAGNIRSIQNMLKKLNVSSEITNEEAKLKTAEKIILPGVGHFDNGMKNLKNANLVEVLNEKVQIDKTPILGICLGAQLLGKKSDEGIENGLGWIDMTSVRFDDTIMPVELKIPHMSWNRIQPKKESKLLGNLEEDNRFYFVHSFHMKPSSDSDILATANYGYEFVACVEKENIYGVQFHPEKSHFFGMQLLRNFAAL